MDSVTEAIDTSAMRAQTRIGTTLRGKWHLDRLLGVGGMAAVYSATHRNGTRAAVKVLHQEHGNHGQVRARFLKEGYIANRVDHPGVVRVLDDDQAEDGSLFIVMELLDGESLQERGQRLGGRLDVEEVLAATDQLLDVLAAAHDRGIIHRDIKPENVFLTRDGVIKVLDFGIARVLELSTASSATRVGTTLGTPAFMAPEHARGLWDEVDARTDLWSVGALMYSLILGRQVHEGRTTNEVLLAAMSKPALSLGGEQGVPASVASLVDRALSYEKARRWPDARAMQDAVRQAFHSSHGAPLSTHTGLIVPPSVPNRTLPSADDSLPVATSLAGTGPAVSSGKTGAPSTASSASGSRRGAVLVVTAATGVAVSAIVAALAGVAIVRRHAAPGEPTGSALTNARGPSVSPETAPLSGASATVGQDTPPTPPSSASTQVFALEALPTAAPEGSQKVDAGPRPAAPRPGADWKAKRK